MKKKFTELFGTVCELSGRTGQMDGWHRACAMGVDWEVFESMLKVEMIKELWATGQYLNLEHYSELRKALWTLDTDLALTYWGRAYPVNLGPLLSDYVAADHIAQCVTELNVRDWEQARRHLFEVWRWNDQTPLSPEEIVVAYADKWYEILWHILELCALGDLDIGA
jgi:hypothetical protein